MDQTLGKIELPTPKSANAEIALPAPKNRLDELEIRITRLEICVDNLMIIAGNAQK